MADSKNSNLKHLVPPALILIAAIIFVPAMLKSKSSVDQPTTTSVKPTESKVAITPGSPANPDQSDRSIPSELLGDASGAPTSPDRGAELFKRSSASVVRIFCFDQSGQVTKYGSGFFVSDDGLVVTNYHVIDGASTLEVGLVSNASFQVDGVVGFSKEDDVAVLKVDAVGVPYLKLRAGDSPPIGTDVYAIGSPQGLTNTFSNGVVSGIRPINAVSSLIQVTAPISPGSSGGPLLDANGNVVGLTTSYLEGGQNLNFVVPANRVSPFLQKPGKPLPLVDVTTKPTTVPPTQNSPVLIPPRWAKDLPFEARISFSVSADDDIRQILEGYWTRELRQINSAVLTDSDPQWSISIVAIADKDASGTVTGYWMSLVMFEYNDASGYTVSVAGIPWKSNAGTIVKHELIYRGKDVLEGGVKEEVAAIEGSVIEDARKSYEQLRETARNRNQQGHDSK